MYSSDRYDGLFCCCFDAQASYYRVLCDELLFVRYRPVPVPVVGSYPFRVRG
jgi:hypothetical protein